MTNSTNGEVDYKASYFKCLKERDVARRDYEVMYKLCKGAEAEVEKLRQCCTQRGARLQMIRERLIGMSAGRGGLTLWDRLWELMNRRDQVDITSWFDEDGVPVRL